MKRLLAAGLVVSLTGCATSSVRSMSGVGQFGDRVLVRTSTTVLHSSWTGSTMEDSESFSLCRLEGTNHVHCEPASVTFAPPPASPAPAR